MMAKTNSASPYPLTLSNVSDWSSPENQADVPKKINAHDKDQKYGYPSVVVYFRIVPVLYRKGGGDDFQWQNDEPLESIVPAHCKSPGRVKKSSRVGGKGTSDGKQHSHLTQSVDGAVQHKTNHAVADDERCWTTVGQRLPRADKQPGTWES
jgi:hypothetical protein